MDAYECQGCGILSRWADPSIVETCPACGSADLQPFRRDPAEILAAVLPVEPVYDPTADVLRALVERGIPVVSPLAADEGEG